MNLVQTVIRARMAADNLSIMALARQLGVTDKTVHNAMYALHEPSPKLLKALRIRREVQYVLEDGAKVLAPVHPVGARQAKSARRRLREARLERERQLPYNLAADSSPAVALSAPEPVGKVRPVKAKSLPKETAKALSRGATALTAERCQVALKHGVRPGPAWAEFSRQVDWAGGADVDVAWLSWCERNEAEPVAKPVAAAQADAGLYAHLGPVTRGPDLRPAGGAVTVQGVAGATGVVAMVPRED